MTAQDIRWQQRLENLKKAFTELEEAVDLHKTRELSKLEKQGLIQAFEYTHELSWNTIRDYFIDQGNFSITGSKDAAREAFKLGIIEDGEAWMDMIKSRNLSSHTYNKETADKVVNNIVSSYYKCFSDLIKVLDKKVS
ncbi:MAG: nucleotidyltransferase substrate binding protein [Bdellovibrionales bacterium]|nr:nucleotidyltransferase substrate binding protein [Bdellovibrionales bacterium]